MKTYNYVNGWIADFFSSLAWALLIGAIALGVALAAGWIDFDTMACWINFDKMFGWLFRAPAL